MTGPATTYRLVRPSLTAAPPVLDEQQQQVVDHEGGPLLVLAGPGTGKTTTLVEAIVRRIDEGTHPDRILALTFSRKAAEQLRDRVTARVGRTMSASIGSTFHSFAYGLIRAKAPTDLYEGPLRLLSAPEQDVVLQELLTDAPSPSVGPTPSSTLSAPAGSPARSRRSSPARGRRGSRAPTSIRLGESTGETSTSRPGPSSTSTSPSSTRRPPSTTPTSSAALRTSPTTTATSCGPATRTSSSTSTKTPTRARSRSCSTSPATAATSSWSATRTSPSTRSAVPRSAGSSSSRVEFPQRRRHARRGRGPRHDAAFRSRADGGHAADRGPPATRRGVPAEAAQAFLEPDPDAAAPPGRVEVFTAATDRRRGRAPR